MPNSAPMFSDYGSLQKCLLCTNAFLATMSVQTPKSAPKLSTAVPNSAPKFVEQVSLQMPNSGQKFSDQMSLQKCLNSARFSH